MVDNNNNFQQGFRLPTVQISLGKNNTYNEENYMVKKKNEYHDNAHLK